MPYIGKGKNDGLADISRFLLFFSSLNLSFVAIYFNDLLNKMLSSGLMHPRAGDS